MNTSSLSLIRFSNPAGSIAYAPGSWGPPAANHRIAANGGWHNPEPAA